MSDKPNNLNKNNDNKQNNVSFSDSQPSDEKPTIPLKGASLSRRKTSILSDESGEKDRDLVENPDTKPTRSKISSLSNDKLQAVQDAKEDKSLNSDKLDLLDDEQQETIKSSKEDVTDSKESSPDAKEIQFDAEGDDNQSETLSRRSPSNILSDGDSFLALNNKKDEESRSTDPETAILSEKSPAWRKVIDAQAAQGTTSTLGEQREVLFVIRGMIERVVMSDNSTVTLGRFDIGTVPNEEIDLIPYGAIDRGVSRRHCQIQLKDNQLLVVDLQSTNGTFLAGVRLKANEPAVLRKGDELLLGRLAVQVLFR